MTTPENAPQVARFVTAAPGQAAHFPGTPS